MVDIDFVYNVSVYKLQNFQTTRRESDGLRKLVLLNNFVYEKFVSPEQDDDLSEWSEEDIKKNEESWLDSCLDELDEVDEDDYVHVNVKPLEHQSTQSTVTPFPINSYDDPRHYDDRYVQEMEYEQQLSKGDNLIDDVIIPHDLLHLPYFDPGDKFHMVIDEKKDKIDDLMNNSNSLSQPSQQDDIININKVQGFSENLTCEKGFHPYWKDNSIIDYPPSSIHPYFDLNTRSFGIPKIFHKYRFDQDDDSSSPRRIVPPYSVLELLQSGYPYQSFESPLKRSKDDLDILCSLTPKDLDRGVLMDRISMVEYYGSKANYNNAKRSNSNEINNMWFMDDNHH